DAGHDGQLRFVARYESPGGIDGASDPDARRHGDLKLATLPAHVEARPGYALAVIVQGDPEQSRRPARPERRAPILSPADAAQQHGTGAPLRAGDDVEARIHAVGRIYVHGAGWAAHDRRAPARPEGGMRGRVVRPTIRFGFKDRRDDQPAAPIMHEQIAPDQVSGHLLDRSLEVTGVEHLKRHPPALSSAAPVARPGDSPVPGARAAAGRRVRGPSR